MIKPICAVCNQELNKPGALLFGPPGNCDLCCKTHLCVSCYTLTQDYLRQVKENLEKEDEQVIKEALANLDLKKILR